MNVWVDWSRCKFFIIIDRIFGVTFLGIAIVHAPSLIAWRLRQGNSTIRRICRIYVMQTCVLVLRKVRPLWGCMHAISRLQLTIFIRHFIRASEQRDLLDNMPAKEEIRSLVIVRLNHVRWTYFFISFFPQLQSLWIDMNGRQWSERARRVISDSNPARWFLGRVLVKSSLSSV